MAAEVPTESLLPKVPIRHWGRYVAGVLLLAVLVALGYAVSQGAIEWHAVPGQLTQSVMLEGVRNTIELAVVAQAGAVVIGVLVALMRLSRNPLVRWVAFGYTWLFRGLPVLLQIILWYNIALIFPRIVVPVPFTSLYLINESSNSLVTPFLAALLGLGLNESAYMAEIVRAGIGSVDPGQREAAESIGMTPAKILRRVVLPQAMRVIVPPTGNDFINMIKGTSLASVIGFIEITKAAQNLSSHSLSVVEDLLAAAVWYMVIVTVANVGQYFLERHYNASLRETGRGLTFRIGRSLRTPPLVRGTA
jgi:polar amino acid transport system permease protein